MSKLKKGEIRCKMCKGKGKKGLSNLSSFRRSYFEGKRENLIAAKSGIASNSSYR